MVKRLLMTGVLLSAIGIGFTGCSVEFGKMDYKEYIKEMEDLDSESYEDKSYFEENNDKEIKLERVLEIKEDVNNIDEIEINLNSGIVIIQESTGDEIEVLANGTKKDITSNLKNKKLNIEEGKVALNLNKNIKRNLVELIKGTELQINIPKNFNKNVTIKVGIGGVAIDKANIKNLKIDIGTGAVFNNQAIKLEKVDVNIGMGLTNLFIDEVKNINIKQEIGGVMVTLKEGKGGIVAENKIGEVIIEYLNGDPSIRPEVKVGEMNAVWKEGETEGTIYAKENIGGLTVRKMTEKQFQERKAMSFFDEFLNKVETMESIIIENTRID